MVRHTKPNAVVHELADDVSESFDNHIPRKSLIDTGRYEAAFDKSGVDFAELDTDVDFEVGRVVYQSFGVIVEMKVGVGGA